MVTDAKTVRADAVAPIDSASYLSSKDLTHLHAPPSLPRGWAQELGRKWQYLRNQEGFLHSPVNTILRLISWRARSLLRSPTTIRLDKWDLQMFLPGEWRGFSKLVFAFRERYEPELPYLEQVLSPGMTFVDAGACYGLYTLAASKIVGETGRVIAFEPASRAFRVLQKNIVLNSLANVLAYPLALTASKGKAMLHYHPCVGCDSLGRDHSFTETAEEIASDCLDDVLQNISINHVDVIKMDVQGAEELVLRGASKILRVSRPTIIFEVYPPAAVLLGLSPNGPWDYLDTLGYEFFVVDRHGKLQRELSPPIDRNVVAIPKQSSLAFKKA